MCNTPNFTVLVVERTIRWKHDGVLHEIPRHIIHAEAAIAGEYARRRCIGVMGLLLWEKDAAAAIDKAYKSTHQRVCYTYDRFGRPVQRPGDLSITRVVTKYGPEDDPFLEDIFVLNTVNGGWDFSYDEEFNHPCSPWRFAGVLTDGRHFLFWNVVGDDGAEICRVYNSIAMDDDTLECEYPWSAENDSILIGCLNNLEDQQAYCGDGSPIQTLEFKWPEKPETE